MYEGIRVKEMRFIFSKFAKRTVFITNSIRTFLLQKDEQLYEMTVLARLELIHESVVKLKKKEKCIE